MQIRRRRGFSTTTISHAAAAAAAAPRLAALKTESDHAAARRWLDDFTLGDIPKHAYEVGYSRSSGPGGQVSHCHRPRRSIWKSKGRGR